VLDVKILITLVTSDAFISLCYVLLTIYSDICCENVGFDVQFDHMDPANESTTTVSFHYSSQPITIAPTNFSNDSQLIGANDSFCRHLLYMTIPPSL